MKALNAFFNVCLCLSFSVHSQAQFLPKVAAHLDNVNKAKEYAATGKTNLAISAYKASVKNDPNDKYAWVGLADVYMLHGDYQDACRAYTQAILKGVIYDSVAYLIDDLSKYRSEPSITRFCTSFDSLKHVFYTSVYNKDFASFIKKLHDTDQAARNITVAGTNDSMRIRTVDLANLKMLNAYLNRHSFPSPGTMDDEVRGNMWIVIHHLMQVRGDAGVALLEHKVMKAVYDGKYKVNDYLRSVDYRHMHDAGKQWYGTYKVKNGKACHYSPDIDDIAHVDERRGRWHMITIATEHIIDDQHPELPLGYKR